MDFEEFKQLLIDSNIIHKNSKELSVSWSLGGSYGSCWDDEVSYSEPSESKPFKELSSALELLYPKLLFTEYNQLYKALVKSSKEYEGDYYGGSTSTQYLTCDLQELYDYLTVNNLLDIQRNYNEL
jgi:hypothetical protein